MSIRRFRIRDYIGLDEVDPATYEGKVVARIEADPDSGHPRIVFTDGSWLVACSEYGEEVEFSEGDPSDPTVQ
jgi:hypothetical protein